MSTENIPLDKQIDAAVRIVAVMGGAIRDLCETRPKGYPSGELYARLMDQLSLSQYTAVINALKQFDCVRETNNLLTWIGPPKEKFYE